MGEFYDAAGKPFLHPVKFTDFNFCSNLAMQHVNPRKSDVLAENGRPYGTGDNTNPRAANVNAIAVTHGLI